MIKILCKWIGLTFMLVLAGCSNDEILTTSGNDSDAELSEGNLVEIVLDKGDVTRTPRPLLYPDISGNNVNVVKLKMVADLGGRVGRVDLTDSNVTLKDNKGEVLSCGENNEWTLTWTSSEGSLDWGESHDDQMAIRIFGLESLEKLSSSSQPKLEIQAYGYHEKDGSLPDGFSISGGVYSYSAPSTGNTASTFLQNVDELFAGENTVGLDNSGNFTETAQVVLTRQVAGLMVCLNEVPIGTREIILSLGNVATGCKFFPSDSEYNNDGTVTITNVDITFNLPKDMDESYTTSTDKGGKVYDFKKYKEDHPNEFPIVPESQSWYGGIPKFDEPLLFASFFLFAHELSTVKIGDIDLTLPDGDKGFKRNHFYYIGTPLNPVSYIDNFGPGE